MTASPSADSYIGSLISLTSKCEIRYEGILYNINTEESSIGLRNVRSFGTEGRKKDGPQIPASDKLYEYILFRSSDIKDLQVKSSPPAQTPSIHNDPAIIQSHYLHPTSASASLPAAGNGPVADHSSHSAPLGLSRPTFQGSLPQYQPGAHLGSWGTMPAPPTANGSGLAMPLYWQGFYAPSGGLSHLQQSSLLRPPPGLPIAQSIQQPLQYPGLNASNLPEFPSPLFSPVNSTLNLTSSTLPSTIAPTQTSLASETAPTLGANPTLLRPLTSTNGPLIESSQTMPSTVISKPMTIPSPTLGYQALIQPQAMPSAVGSSNSNTVESAMSLVTPDQLLQPALSTVPSSQPVQTNNKDVEVKPKEARKTPSVSEPSVRAPPKIKEPIKEPRPPKIKEPIKEPRPPKIKEPIKVPLIKEPILPLPKPTHHKPNGAVMHSHYYYSRGRGRGRGRGNGYSRPITKFTEEFDFTAMNEKFNKDEVWGHLGKSKTLPHDGGEGEEDEDENLEDDAEAQKPEIKPVYVKDDFFDTLSCNTLNQDSQGRRIKFSEQLKVDTETFGDFPRQRPSNRGGGRGFRGGGRAHGFHYGRGYGYVARGRGHAVPNRAS